VRRLESGEARLVAVSSGAREVALPVLVSVLTFAVAFFPVVFLTGIARFLFTPLAVAVILAIAAGYLVAMFLLPLSARALLAGPVGAHRSGESRGIGAWCEHVVGRLLRLKYAVLGASVVGLVGGLLLLATLGRELFPPIDASQFTIYVRMPSGTRLEKTEAALAEIERSLIDEIGAPDTEYPVREAHRDSNLRILISNAGVLYDWPAAYTPNEGPMDAFVLVQLKGKRGMPSTFEYVARLRQRLTRNFPGVSFAFDTGGMLTAALNFGLPSPIDVQVQGNNLQVLGEIAGEIRHIASGVPGAVDVRVAQRNDYPQLVVEVDRVKAAQIGLTQDDVIKNLVTSLNSSVGFNPAFWIDEKNRNHYFLGAQYREDDIVSMETLLNIPVTGGNGSPPAVLRNLVQVTQRQGPASVSHMNITRTFNVYANVLPGFDVGSVASEIQRRLRASEALKPAPRASARGLVYDLKGPRYEGKGYVMAMRGEAHSMRESLRAFAGGLALAVVLIYLAMVALLRSFRVPLAVMLAVPMGLIGVALMLRLTGSALSIPSAMGILMMSGIVVQFGIILLMFAEQLVGEGVDPAEAIARAVRLRIRPITMTALAACLAMAPMAIGGRGAEANAPLARAIIGGVIAAGVLTLFVVPCLYVVLRGRARKTVASADSGAIT
jgi:multidrug efflux pump subunit AcrB